MSLSEIYPGKNLTEQLTYDHFLSSRFDLYGMYF